MRDLQEFTLHSLAKSNVKIMRRSMTTFCRLIACLLMLTVLSDSVAMAAYVCPQGIQAPVQAVMAPMENCAGMDVEKPALCVTQHSGVQLALEHLTVPPALAPVTVSTIAPVSLPRVVSLPPNLAAATALQSGHAPPYLRTQRLRI